MMAQAAVAEPVTERDYPVKEAFQKKRMLDSAELVLKDEPIEDMDATTFAAHQMMVKQNMRDKRERDAAMYIPRDRQRTPLDER